MNKIQSAIIETHDHLITKFIGPYITTLKDGTTVKVEDVEQELWYIVDDSEVKGHIDVLLSADACDKIDSGIEQLFPDYFKKKK